MGCEIRFEWFLGLSLFLESHATLEREREGDRDRNRNRKKVMKY